jgi:hypothetical protein
VNMMPNVVSTETRALNKQKVFTAPSPKRRNPPRLRASEEGLCGAKAPVFKRD